MGRNSDIESGMKAGEPAAAKLADYDEKRVGDDALQRGMLSSFFDGFKSNDDREAMGMTAAERTATSPLMKNLKARHLEMIGIGGAVGTGLFVGTGSALSQGGPASLLLGFFFVGIILYLSMYSMGELAVTFPITGAFSAFSSRFIDPGWGFAMGWNYAIQWLVTLPLELVGAAMTLQFWNSSVEPWAFVLIFLVVIVIINLFGVKGYGEIESALSIIKILAVLMFIVLGIILDVGGGPNGEYIGGKYWKDPGAFNFGWQGFLSVLVTAAFSFSGAEMVGLGAAETKDPEKAVPSAIKHAFWRIFLSYMICIVLVGLLVPYTDSRLLDTGTGSSNTNASPFVIAIVNAGISGLPSFINAIILITLLSVGNSSVYGSSRTLVALAEQNQAPRCFAFIDRKGRPMVALVITFAFGLLGFLAQSSAETTVFAWLLSLSGLSSVITWGSICLAHIRFRAACTVQGVATSEIPYRSPVGLWGSWLGFVLNVIVLILQLVISILPEDYQTMSAADRANTFWEAYLAVPLTAVCFIGYKIWRPAKLLSPATIDVQTGRAFKKVGVSITEKRPLWRRIVGIVA